MAGSLFARTTRLLGAQIEGVLDKAEGASALSLMRQSVQEIDTAIDQENLRRSKAEAQITQNDLRHGQVASDIKEWKERARFALSKDREDLARDALAETVRLKELSDRLSASSTAARLEISEADDALEQLRNARREMALSLNEAQREHALNQRAEAETKAKTSAVSGQLDRAQELFERSARIAKAGGPDTVSDSKLAIDALRREEAIEAELAALKKASKSGRRKKSDS